MLGYKKVILQSYYLTMNCSLYLNSVILRVVLNYSAGSYKQKLCPYFHKSIRRAHHFRLLFLCPSVWWSLRRTSWNSWWTWCSPWCAMASSASPACSARTSWIRWSRRSCCATLTPSSRSLPEGSLQGTAGVKGGMGCVDYKYSVTLLWSHSYDGIQYGKNFYSLKHFQLSCPHQGVVWGRFLFPCIHLISDFAVFKIINI